MKGKTCYLVDLENVGLDGIHLTERLPSDDVVHIFSTVNGPKLDITTLARLGMNELTFHEIHPGKQSVDMHLVSYLGFLIHADQESEYVIVSKDKDYDEVISFWKAKQISLTRREMIKPAGKATEKVKDGKKENPLPEKNEREKIIRDFISTAFQGKKYKGHREEIVQAVLNAETRVQVNNNLMKIIPSSEIKNVYDRLRPVIADMPGN